MMARAEEQTMEAELDTPAPAAQHTATGGGREGGREGRGGQAGTGWQSSASQ